MRHIIRKQLIDLGVDKELDAFSVQQDVSVFYWDHIIPLLERVFNDLSNTGEVITIDKLEIELGNFAPKEIKQKWDIDKLLSEITSQLYSQIKFGRDEGIKITRQKQESNIFRQWLFYMENGFLPWNVIIPAENWYEKVLESIAMEYQSAEELKLLIRTDTDAVERIILQHPVIYLVHLTELLTARKQEKLPVYIEDIYKLMLFSLKKSKDKITAGKRSFEINVWKKILLLSASPHTDLSTERIAEILIRLLLTDPQILHLMELKTVSRKVAIIYPLLVKIAGEPGKSIDGTIKIKMDPPREENGTGIQLTKDKSGDNEKGNEETMVNDARLAIEKNEKNKNRENDEEDIRVTTKKMVEEGIFTRNGGLVLLNPFIYHFFYNLHLTNAGKFVDLHHQQKALYLLHYLATARTEAQEHELIIAKVLCGYPIHQVVERQMILAADELQEAGQLLEEVIAQWEILKNTSPDGLREGFLQRPGKLDSKNDHFCLHLEKSSIDILLDYLPWKLSVVQLPWMKQRLTVEWR
ncbi:MAG: contractile injection system tape measure protein [Ginsengibacter sp.]